MSTITELAARQLAAYNACDLDAFCACYHPDVAVWDAEAENLRGVEAFRARYEDMFARWTFGATVDTRLDLGPHCIDYESYWRIDPETNVRSDGKVLVRYTEKAGLIGLVQFLD